MEIRRWLYYVVVNCALVYCIVGKPISLNKIIEEELLEGGVLTTIAPKFEEPEPVAERFSLNKGLKPISRISRHFKGTGTALNLIPLGKKISPLKYRKTFQIKSPLKPKRIKQSLRIGHNRKNQAVKREIDGNAILNQKYIPLLKNLGMLFDDILGSGSGESFEVPKSKRKRPRYYLGPEGDDNGSCQCPRQRESNAESESEKTTTTFSETLTTDISVATEAPAEAADTTSTSNLRSFRQNKNVSLLLPRNPFSTRRNNHGLSEGSRPAHNRSAERDISGDHGDSEYNSEWRPNVSSAQSDEEYTRSASRNGASGVRNPGGIPRRADPGNNTEEIYENDAISKDETENNSNGSRGHVVKHNGQDKLTNRRDEAKSANVLQKSLRRQGGYLSERKIVDSSESVQSKDDNEESDVSFANNSSGDQRVINRNGSPSSKDQKASPRHETVTHESREVVKPQLYSSKFTKKLKLKPLRRQQEFLSKNKVDTTAKPIHSDENSKERDVSSAQDTSDSQLVIVKDGSLSLKDQKASSKYTILTHQLSEEDKPDYYSTKFTNKLLPEPLQKQRKFLSKNKFANTANPIHSEEVTKESDVSIAQDTSDDQLVIVKGGSLNLKDQKASSKHTTVTNQLSEEDKPHYYSTKFTNKLLPKPFQKQRKFLSKNKFANTANPVHSKEDNEESDASIAQDTSDDQLVIVKGGSQSFKDQKASSKYTILTHQLSEEGKPHYYSTKFTNKLLPKPLQKPRKFLSQNGFGNTANPLHSKEDNEENDVSIGQDSSNDQLVNFRDGSVSLKDHLAKASSRHETAIHHSSEADIHKYNSTKSTKKILRDPLGKRRFLSKDKIDNTAEFQSEQRYVSVPQDSSDDQRVFGTDYTFSSEDLKTSLKHKTAINSSKVDKPQYYSTKSKKTISPEPLGKQQGFLSENKIGDIAEFQSEEKGFRDPHNSSDDQRIFDRDLTLSSDQKSSSRYETLIPQVPEVDTLKFSSTKSEKNRLPEHFVKQRGFISEDKGGHTAAAILSEENYEQSEVNFAHDSSQDKVIISRDNLVSSENRHIIPKHETIIQQSSEVDKPQLYDKVRDVSQSKEIGLESNFRIAHNSSENQQIFDKNVSASKTSPRLETVQLSSEVDKSHFYTTKPTKRILPKVSDTLESEEMNEENQFSIAHNEPIFARDNSATSENRQVNFRHKTAIQQSSEEDNTQIYTKKSSKNTLPDNFQRQQAFLSDDKATYTSESKEISIESNLSVTHDSSEEQILFNKDNSPLYLKASSHETVINQAPKVEDKNLQYDSTKSSRNKGSVVLIYDGYSVTRRKNGENKLAEKAIHIHP